MASQSLEKKMEEFVRIPYLEADLKVDFVIDPNAVIDMRIDEYQFDYGQSIDQIDTTVIKSHFLKYKDGKLVSNLVRARSTDDSFPAVQLEKVMTYDSFGRLRKIVTTHQSDDEKTVILEKFKHADGVIDRIYYSGNDTIKPDGDMYKYYLDNENYVIKEFLIINKFARNLVFKYNQNKDMVFTNSERNNIKFEHSYDKFGNKIQTLITVTNISDGAFQHSSIEKFIYDSNNNLTKEITGEKSSHVVEYIYKDNRLATKTKIVNGKLYTKNIYKYDGLGNWIEIEVQKSFEDTPYTEKVVKRVINYKH
jgi:histidinol phosphatase-like enzyme